MNGSIAGINPYNLFFFTTRLLLIIGHMARSVVKSIVIQINGHCYGYMNNVKDEDSLPGLWLLVCISK